MNHSPKQNLMTVQDASEFLGLSVSTLNKWRCYGKGPVFLKLGRVIRYRKEDLETYIEERLKSSTSAY